MAVLLFLGCTPCGLIRGGEHPGNGHGADGCRRAVSTAAGTLERQSLKRRMRRRQSTYRFVEIKLTKHARRAMRNTSQTIRPSSGSQHAAYRCVCVRATFLAGPTGMCESEDGTILLWLKRAARLFAVLTLLGPVATHGAEPQKIKSPWEASESDKKAKNPVKVTREGLNDAAKLYLQNCLICHGKTGAGNGPQAKKLPQKPANFTDAKMMSKVTDGELFWKMSTGRPPMPAWQAQLSDTQRWQLVNYIRAFAGR
jgi:mono/diheme cytochrome c family protein